MQHRGFNFSEYNHVGYDKGATLISIQLRFRICFKGSNCRIFAMLDERGALLTRFDLPSGVSFAMETGPRAKIVEHWPWGFGYRAGRLAANSELKTEVLACFTKVPIKYLVFMESPLIANGAEIFRIDGGVGKSKFSRKMEVSR
jgi:hypothetical protein